MRRSWKVLAVVAVGVFMAEPRPVHRQHRLPGHRSATSPDEPPRRPVLGAERVRDRVRGAARPGRPAGRSRRAAADVPRRAGRLRSPPRRCAASRRRCAAGRGARRPGGGRRAAGPDLARRCCCRSSRPSGAPTAVGLWAPSAASPPRSGRRSAALLVEASAGAGCSSSTCRRPGRAGGRRARILREVARAPDAARPDAARRAAARRRRRRCSRSASSRARTGAGAAPACSGLRARPPSLLVAFVRRARRATRRR